jgi:tryptophan synthase beta subunit
MFEKSGKLPDAIVDRVRGGSNAIEAFHPFIKNKEVVFNGAEAAGHGVDIDEEHWATLAKEHPVSSPVWTTPASAQSMPF